MMLCAGGMDNTSSHSLTVSPRAAVGDFMSELVIITGDWILTFSWDLYVKGQLDSCGSTRPYGNACGQNSEESLHLLLIALSAFYPLQDLESNRLMCKKYSTYYFKVVATYSCCRKLDTLVLGDSG